MIAELERLVRPSDMGMPAAVEVWPAAVPIPGPMCPRCGCQCGHRRPAGCEPCPRPRWWRRYSRG